MTESHHALDELVEYVQIDIGKQLRREIADRHSAILRRIAHQFTQVHAFPFAVIPNFAASICSVELSKFKL